MKKKLGVRFIASMLLVVSLMVSQLPMSMLEVKASEPDGSGVRSYTNITTGDVFLGGKFIEVGITKEGSLGTVGTAPMIGTPVEDAVTGRWIYFHPSEYSGNRIGMVTNANEDGAEEGWNSITCDYFLPATINEAWMLGWDNIMQAAGCSAGNGTIRSTGIISATTKNLSTANLLSAETTIITDTNIQIVQTIFFEPEDKNFNTSVEITNLGEENLTNVRYMRSFDPDQGQGSKEGCTNQTINVIGHEDLDAAGVSVIAYKVDRMAPFIFFTTDERAVAGWAKNLNTTVYSIEREIASGTVSITPGDEITIDGNIFLYYDFPTLNSGETVSIDYYSSLDTNLFSAIEGILGLDISSTEVEEEILNTPEEKVSAFVSASITGVDVSTCEVSYKWYISDSPDVVETGKVIDGATTGKYVFVPTGNREDAGTYYLCCEVTAVSGEQSVTKCSKNLKITVYNEFEEFPVHWDIDGDGEIDETELILEGTMPSHENGYREDTEQYYYNFIGWDKAFAEVTEEVTYTAMFQEKVKKYKVEWDVDGDGKADSAELVNYGEIPFHEPVEKTADYQYTYQFAGWSPELASVTKNQMYSVVFENITNQYEVHWPKNMLGYEIIPEHGSTSPVEYNGRYSFSIKNKEGYDLSTVEVVANGKTLVAEDGIYTVSDIGMDGEDVWLEIVIADTTAPKGTIIIDEDRWTTLQKNITFDRFYKTMQNVRFEVSDLGSGVQSVSYYISEGELEESQLKNLTWIPCNSNLFIRPNMRGIIYAKFVDLEDNVSYASTCGLVLEEPADKAEELWKYEEVSKLEDHMEKETTDEDIEGSLYNKVRARVASSKAKKQTIKWSKVTDADGYIIYGNRCNSGGRIYKMKRLKTITNPNTTKWTHKKLKKATYYKYMVVAYRHIDGKEKIISVSKKMHAITAGGKNVNPKGVKIKQKKITIKVGKKKKIKAIQLLPKDGKLRMHVNKFRYESSNKKIATIDRKGKVTGKQCGTCYAFVYVQNGIYKMVKVTVK